VKLTIRPTNQIVLTSENTKPLFDEIIRVKEEYYPDLGICIANPQWSTITEELEEIKFFVAEPPLSNLISEIIAERDDIVLLERFLKKIRKTVKKHKGENKQ
jgi:hypothetical protein